MLYSDEQYKLFRDELRGDSIGIIWSAMRADNFGKTQMSFEEKKKYFFELIQMLIDEKMIQLTKNGTFIGGTTEEQIDHFKEAFPDNEEGLYHDLWFTFDECPSEIVWMNK